MAASARWRLALAAALACLGARRARVRGAGPAALHRDVHGRPLCNASASPLGAITERACAPAAPRARCFSRAPEPDPYQYVFLLSALCRERRAGADAPGLRVRTDPSCAEAPTLYLDATKHAIATLQGAGARHGVTLLVHDALFATHARALAAAAAWAAARSVALCAVPGFGAAPEHYHFAKAHVWQMGRAFRKVAFVDADHLFVASPDGVFEACRAGFCAVGPPPTAEPPPAHARHRFNAGFWVATPDASALGPLLRGWRGCANGSSGARFHARSENGCLERVLTGVQGLEPRWSRRNTEIDRDTDPAWAAAHPRDAARRRVLGRGADTVGAHAKFWRARCSTLWRVWGAWARRAPHTRSCALSAPPTRPADDRTAAARRVRPGPGGG